jgi:hypothetical protein
MLEPTCSIQHSDSKAFRVEAIFPSHETIHKLPSILLVNTTSFFARDRSFHGLLDFVGNALSEE